MEWERQWIHIDIQLVSSYFDISFRKLKTKSVQHNLSFKASCWQGKLSLSNTSMRFPWNYVSPSTTLPIVAVTSSLSRHLCHVIFVTSSLSSSLSRHLCHSAIVYLVGDYFTLWSSGICVSTRTFPICAAADLSSLEMKWSDFILTVQLLKVLLKNLETSLATHPRTSGPDLTSYIDDATQDDSSSDVYNNTNVCTVVSIYNMLLRIITA